MTDQVLRKGAGKCSLREGERMNTIILYASMHHGNTKQLTNRIIGRFPECKCVNVLSESIDDLTRFDQIGFASGIAFGKFYPQIEKVMKELLPEGKNVFFIYTSGTKGKNYTKSVRAIAEEKGAKVLGEFGCRGFDTYGPFKIIGGLSRKHPNENDFSKAIEFFMNLSRSR